MYAPPVGIGVNPAVGLQGGRVPSRSDRVEKDPSPTALRSPLSPGERGDRKAVGEGSLRGCIHSSRGKWHLGL